MNVLAKSYAAWTRICGISSPRRPCLLLVLKEKTPEMTNIENNVRMVAAK
jgi:hypothetical protein